MKLPRHQSSSFRWSLHLPVLLIGPTLQPGFHSSPVEGGDLCWLADVDIAAQYCQLQVDLLESKNDATYRLHVRFHGWYFWGSMLINHPVCIK